MNRKKGSNSESTPMFVPNKNMKFPESASSSNSESSSDSIDVDLIKDIDGEGLHEIEVKDDEKKEPESCKNSFERITSP
jgi:hypothetical protein